MTLVHQNFPHFFATVFGKFGPILLALLAVMTTAGTEVQAQTVNCVIASNDGRNGFRTDEISRCRVDISNGNASFVINAEQRSRSYVSVQPLTSRHLDVATYWLNRTGQLRVPARTNPAGFDPRSFLQAAAQATHGFVLVRQKNSGAQAVNLVYITDGVYRSIDFSGTNFREVPAGFLTTAP